MYLLLQITITKSYKLSTTIIYTEMTNNNKKKTLEQMFSCEFKSFLNVTKKFH